MLIFYLLQTYRHDPQTGLPKNQGSCEFFDFFIILYNLMIIAGYCLYYRDNTLFVIEMIWGLHLEDWPVATIGINPFVSVIVGTQVKFYLVLEHQVEKVLQISSVIFAVDISNPTAHKRVVGGSDHLFVRFCGFAGSYKLGQILVGGVDPRVLLVTSLILCSQVIFSCVQVVEAMIWVEAEEVERSQIQSYGQFLLLAVLLKWEVENPQVILRMMLMVPCVDEDRHIFGSLW